MKKITGLFLLSLCVVIILIAGCTSQTTSTPVTPSQTQATTQVTTTNLPITPQTTTITTRPQTYKTADVVLIQTLPSVKFKMDFPSDWTNKNEGTATDWRARYNFSSPDEKTYVSVLLDEGAGSGNYWYPLDVITENSLYGRSWADNVIKSMKIPYCHDGVGNPIECSSSAPSSSYYYSKLINNEPVILSGNVKARKLVYAPDAKDISGYWSTYYLMHVGDVQGYNFTVPGHYEVAVKVDGPVWDYGMGGRAIEIVTRTPDNQVKATSEIFDYMIKSFKVTA